jgi:hypothetical protein
MNLKNGILYFLVILLVESGVFISSCSNDYEGVEIGFNSFIEDEEAANIISMQREQAEENKLDVGIMVGTITDVEINAANFSVSYDPELIKFTGYDESGYFGSKGTATIWINDSESGLVELQITRTGGSIPENSIGKLVELHFKAIKYIKETAEEGGCKGDTRKANFSYLDVIDGRLLDGHNELITGISWYGGVYCIFDNS